MLLCIAATWRCWCGPRPPCLAPLSSSHLALEARLLPRPVPVRSSSHLSPQLRSCLPHIPELSPFPLPPLFWCRTPGSDFALPWAQRHRVALDVAQAIMYLHTGLPELTPHGNVTSSNVMLIKDGLAAKVSCTCSCVGRESRHGRVRSWGRVRVLLTKRRGLLARSTRSEGRLNFVAAFNSHSTP